jgi:hypothetical protein
MISGFLSRIRSATREVSAQAKDKWLGKKWGAEYRREMSRGATHRAAHENRIEFTIDPIIVSETGSDELFYLEFFRFMGRECCPSKLLADSRAGDRNRQSIKQGKPDLLKLVKVKDGLGTVRKNPGNEPC